MAKNHRRRDSVLASSIPATLTEFQQTSRILASFAGIRHSTIVFRHRLDSDLLCRNLMAVAGVEILRSDTKS
jgi:hypothetical protein